MTTKTNSGRKKAPKADPAQSRLFIQKAREIGADEEDSGADELLGLLHSKAPEPHQTPKNKRRSTR